MRFIYYIATIFLECLRYWMNTQERRFQGDAVMRDARDPRLHRQRREKMEIVKEKREARKKYKKTVKKEGEGGSSSNLYLLT